MKVLLRDLIEEDALISYKWRNDPEVWKLTTRTWNNHVTEEIERKWIKDSLISNSVKRMAICVGDDARYVGNVQLTDIADGKAFFHIFIGDKQFWGKGIGKIAAGMMIAYAKDVMGLREVRLFVLRDNLRATQIYRSIGFTEVSEHDGIIAMTMKL